MENLLIVMTLLHIQSVFNCLLPIFLYIIKIFNIHIFLVTNREDMNNLNHLFKDNFCTGYMDSGVPYGIIIPPSLDYIAYKCDVHGTGTYVVTTKSKYESMIEKVNVIPRDPVLIENATDHLTLFSRNGSYDFLQYKNRRISIGYEFNEPQKKLYQDLVYIYQEKKHVKCFVYGETDVGKTMFAYLTAKELNGSFCDSFNPTEPSDSFHNLYTTVKPSATSPLILLLDEVDVLLKKVHASIEPHKKYMIDVRNKTTWNSMLDKIDYGIYPYVIMILCSNKTPKEIDSLDSSYLRPGRIDFSHRLTKGLDEDYVKEN